MTTSNAIIRLAAIATAVLASPVSAYAQAGRAEARDGNRLYEQGRFQEAHERYLEGLAAAPESGVLRFNDGNALYRSDDYQRALEAYQRAIESGDAELAGSAWYNLGNALYRQQQLEQSLEAYKQALRLDPSDVDAKHNLERVLEQMQQQQQQQAEPRPTRPTGSAAARGPAGGAEPTRASAAARRAAGSAAATGPGGARARARADDAAGGGAPPRSGGGGPGQPEPPTRARDGCETSAAVVKRMRAFCVSLLACAALGVIIAAPVSGQDVSVRAYLTPASVAVGRPFSLNVEIAGTQSLTEEPQVPDLGHFAQYLGSSSQSSMRVVNGRSSVSLTVEYRFQALREGIFEIPAFDVVAGGATHTTEALEVTVSTTGQQGAGASAPAGVSANDLFVTAEATKTRVRDGEPFVVEYRLWTLVDISSFNFTRVPEPQGFWVEDVTPPGQPQVEQLRRNGRQYTTAVIRRVALVPSGPGERTLDPVGLEVQVRVRRSDPFGDFFGRSVEPTTVLSNPLTVSVAPLPRGRPEPFSGVVGRLAITAAVDRDSVATNEAVTLTVRASGEGNIRAVPAPVLGLPPDFEVFPPEISESVQPFGPGLSGEKTFEYVLIPRAPGSREIPVITMGYFDERAGAYRTASTRALPLAVTGVAGGGPAGAARGGVAQLREDIRFIRLAAGTLQPRDRARFAGAAFWMLALLPLVGVAGALAVRRQRDLLEGDVAYARGRRAGRVARKRLAEARRLAAGADTRPFYAEVARALRGLVADRLNLAEAGLQSAELEQRLGARGVPEGMVAEVHACLDHCDRQRFAPPGTDPHEKSRFLDRVGAVMTALDKAIR